VIGATQDRIAGLQPVQALAAAMTQAEFVQMNTGHLAPFEDPVAWRTHMLEFMNR
jgi:pimeloyl-ACP methyl ester carboxylesterase